MSHITHNQGRAMMRRHRYFCQAGAGVLLWAAMCVGAFGFVGPAPAFGAQGHVFSSVFGGAGSGSGELSLAVPMPGETPGSGVAVDDMSGNVFVADTNNHRVDEFTAGGAFVRAWGWGVASGAAEFQVCTPTSGCLVGLSGSGAGEFESPVYAAVDNDAGSASVNDVYVGDTGDALVSKFDSEGHLIAGWGNNGGGGVANGQLNGVTGELFDGGNPGQLLAGIAVDASGDLWVYDHDANLFEFDQAGSPSPKCRVPITYGTGVGGIATSGSALYVLDGFDGVWRLESGCTGPGAVTSGEERALGLAVDASDGDLYVDEDGRLIEDIPAGCVPSSHGCVASQFFGEGVLYEASGVAVDPGSGAVYVANGATDQIAVFPVAVAATVESAGEVRAHSALLRGTVNPEGAELSRCRFEYGEGEAYDHSVPCEEGLSSIGDGSTSVGVQAKVEGLAGGAAYEYRLRATNAKGDVRSESEPLDTSTVAKIEEASTAEIHEAPDGSVSALLTATVDPENISGTSCEIEYGTSTSYGNTIPCEPADLAGGAGVGISGHVAGLARSTAYSWRVVVQDANGVAAGANQTFVYLTETAGPSGCANEALRETNNSTLLPDCRAYEQVTPVEKNGALITTFIGDNPGFSAEGSSFVDFSDQCFGGAQACFAARDDSIASPFEFARTPEGWVTQPLDPPATQFVGASLKLDSPNTGDTLFGAVPVATGASSRELLYVRDKDGSLQQIGPATVTGTVEGGGLFAATADLSRIVYSSNYGALWPSFDQTEGEASPLYEYAGPGEHPFLVAVTGGMGSTELVGKCGAAFGGLPVSSAPNWTALSEDGSTVYFTVEPCPGGSVNRLYARVDGEGEGARTVPISVAAPEPQCDTACQAQPAGNAVFAGASGDGSKVYFLSPQQLTDQASEDSQSSGCSATARAGGCNLYLYDDPQEEPLSGAHLVDVSAGDTSGLGPQVQGVLAFASDGSRVYFVAKGVLAGRNPEGGEPREGAENLYVYDTTEAKTRFIATLSAADERQWSEGANYANVTSDGGYLLFASHAALTGDVTRREGPAQVYRYDAESERLNRVSIGRLGFDDDGNSGAGNAEIVPAEDAMYGESSPIVADPSLSANGSRAFFESPVGLTSRALNDVAVNNRGGLAENIYEWEQDGTGSCAEAAGCIYLISDGKDASEGPASVEQRSESSVELLGTDASGEDVLFSTVDRLAASDTDTELDIYDARVEGGFAAPSGEEPCSGEACKGPGSVADVFGAPASVTFSGPANTPSEVKAAGGHPSPLGLTREQQLGRSLAACRRRYASRKSRGKRATCERQAHQRYGPPKTKGKKKHKAGAVKASGSRQKASRG